MNVNVTANTNVDDMIGLDPRGLRVVDGGGLHALEIVAEPADVSPLLKAAVVETLAIIGIVQVCSLTPTNQPRLPNNCR